MNNGRSLDFEVSQSIPEGEQQAPQFLVERMPRPWALEPESPFKPAGLHVGRGAHAIEVVVGLSPVAPSRGSLMATWKARRARRAAPVLLVILHPAGAALCTAIGNTLQTYANMSCAEAERISRGVLEEPNRHAALHFLAQALPTLETAVLGLNNVGLLAVPRTPNGSQAKNRLALCPAQGERGPRQARPFIDRGAWLSCRETGQPDSPLEFR